MLLFKVFRFESFIALADAVSLALLPMSKAACWLKAAPKFTKS